MLTVTDAAAEAIISLVIKNQMPEGSGLRISRQSDTTRSEGLGLSIAKAPAEDESVLESNGVKIFLSRALSDVLQNQELHVQRSTEDGEEKLNFTVEQKPKPKQ
ncbi:MAG: adhesin [Pseudonocardiales bacterium]